eukprot:gb/GECH01011866.1/.p1 GENE.gb/GECH01011866.1/~~gb/GECH01011866.1/.p1  ORF type:complete len:312 (+),score=56.39 gb/GECH01011866.1/:1-936(+)
MDFFADKNKRCYKEARQLYKHLKDSDAKASLEHMHSNLVSPAASMHWFASGFLPELLRYNACVLQPLADDTLNEKLENCLYQNNNSIEKCESIVNDMVIQGEDRIRFYVNSIVASDMVIRSASVKDWCRNSIEESRRLGCSVNPNSSQCRKIQQQAFPCIAFAACSDQLRELERCHDVEERFVRSNEVTSGDVARSLATGVNMVSQARTQLRDHCAVVRLSIRQCVDRYWNFLNSTDASFDSSHTDPKNTTGLSPFKAVYLQSIPPAAQELYQERRRQDTERERVFWNRVLQQSAEERAQIEEHMDQEEDL